MEVEKRKVGVLKAGEEVASPRKRSVKEAAVVIGLKKSILQKKVEKKGNVLNEKKQVMVMKILPRPRILNEK